MREVTAGAGAGRRPNIEGKKDNAEEWDPDALCPERSFLSLSIMLGYVGGMVDSLDSAQAENESKGPGINA